jgi:hypothetical protein
MRSSLPLLALAPLALASAPTLAQAPASGWTPFVSAGYIYLGDADVGDRGKLGTQGYQLSAGVLGELAPRLRTGLVVQYDRYNYTFDVPNGLSRAAESWTDVERYGVAVPITYAFDGGWVANVTPSVDVFRETTASASDAVTYGASMSVSRAFAPGQRLGLGAAVFRRLYETKVFPIVVIDWALSDQWRLVNPLSSGPTGPAGVELVYQPSQTWKFGLAAAYRSLAFRLDDGIPGFGGVGEESGVPLVARASYSITPSMSLDFYAGAVVNGELKIIDSAGNTRSSADLGTVPLFAVNLSARF